MAERLRIWRHSVFSKLEEMESRALSLLSGGRLGMWKRWPLATFCSLFVGTMSPSLGVGLYNIMNTNIFKIIFFLTRIEGATPSQNTRSHALLFLICLFSLLICLCSSFLTFLFLLFHDFNFYSHLLSSIPLLRPSLILFLLPQTHQR